MVLLWAKGVLLPQISKKIPWEGAQKYGKESNPKIPVAYSEA